VSTFVDWRKPESLETLNAGLEHGLAVIVDISNNNRLDAWHAKVLSGLLQTGLHALRNLCRGWNEHEVSLMAWSARNALELELWVEYVTASQENAYRFHLDWLNDTAEILSKSIETEKADELRRHREGISSPPSFPYPDMDFGEHTVKDAEAFLAKHRAQNPSLSRKYLRIREIAKILGKEETFNNMSSLFSKHIHPTAYSVLSFPSDRLRLNLSTIMLENGCLSLIRALGTVDRYLLDKELPRIFSSPDDSTKTP
jgi:hypothetical protein